MNKKKANWMFDASTEQLQEIRHQLKTCLQSCNIETSLTEEIVIAVNEACMNIIQHAYSSDIDRGSNDRKIDINVTVNAEEIKIIISDNAAYIDLDCINCREYDDIKPGGLGVAFIREIMDTVSYSHNKQSTRGNRLIMTRRLNH